jgi:hypothetical protein
MICYRDRTFCPFYDECKHGETCPAALTPKVKEDAEKWWGKPDAPIAYYVDKPECFEEKE